MRSIAGALVLLIVLAAAGLVAMRQLQALPPAGAASGALPAGGPAGRADVARQRAKEDVVRAFDAASAARDAAETR